MDILDTYKVEIEKLCKTFKVKNLGNLSLNIYKSKYTPLVSNQITDLEKQAPLERGIT